MRKLMFLLFPLVSMAQEGKMDAFDENISWEQAKLTAKEENKYVFLDIYTTWCGPCKQMDLDVYGKDSVAKLLRENFIPIKVQMDSTSSDDNYIKSWYVASREINNKYHIEGYPSFLFFAPDGRLVYKDIGYKSLKDFIKLIKRARDPQNLLYYDILEDYKKGKKSYGSMNELAIYVKNIMQNKALAIKIAGDYKYNYLDKLDSATVLANSTIEFFDNFPGLLKERDLFFHLCLDYPNIVDTVGRHRIGWAMNCVKRTLTEIELKDDLIKENKPIFKNPPWKEIAESIHDKYPTVDVNDLLLEFKIRYYRSFALDWKEWFNYKDQKLNQLYSKKDAILEIELNIFGAWDVFLHCNNKKVIRRSLKWIDWALKLNSTSDAYMDTKANLLYKLGKIQDAIEEEHKAFEAISAYYKSHPKKILLDIADGYARTIEQMKVSKPTYLSEGAYWDKYSLKRIQRYN